MATVNHIVNDAGHQVGVQSASVFNAFHLGILLNCPYCPQRNVGEVNTTDATAQIACLHIVKQLFRSSCHDAFKVGFVVDCEGWARQWHESVAGKHYTPGITRNDEVSVFIFEVALFCRIFQAVVETCATSATCDFAFIHLVERTGSYGLDTSREYHRFTFLDGNFKITGNPQVFGIRNTAFKVFDIFNAFIPVRVIMPSGLVTHLHIKCGITIIKAAWDTIGNFGTFLVKAIVFHTQFARIAECQERTELQCCGRMSLYKCVTNENAIFVRDKNFLFGENHATNAIGCAGHALTVKLTNVFVPVGAINTTAITVNTEIKRRTVLYYRLVERRQHDMRLIVHFWNGYNEQPVLFARVATHHRCTMISPRLICA